MPTPAEQINDALLAYCRGIDRLDGDAILEAFHPGAMLEDYGADPMPIETFVDYAIASLERRFVATQHRISNTRIEFDGGDAASGADSSGDRPSALVETYVLAFHAESTDDGDRLHTFNGRYVDRFVPIDDDWRIERRVLRHDWSKVESIERPMAGAWVQSGRAGAPDPLHGLGPSR